MVGVESLARFPKEPYQGPGEWFDAAANAGLAHALEIRAIEKGTAALEELPGHCYVACNISAAALVEGSITKALQDLPLERMVLEFTEHDAINDYEALQAALSPLRKRGLRTAVDDAGAGFASFQHILQLNPDIVKLDISLTRNIHHDVARRALTAALVRFSHEIGSKLVAEGVERREELDTLENLGVEFVQGYFLHRPMPKADLRKLFIRN